MGIEEGIGSQFPNSVRNAEGAEVGASLVL